MTGQEIARRLRDIADREPTYVWRELYALAREIEDKVAATIPAPEAKRLPDDMEALVRATQPPTRPAKVTPLTVARAILGRRR
ncbi:hypothetical protein ACU635_51005 [[Actinomadura] parvosata]|uniref:hypothetical protein n=1 Tax=[Actinomadura] parvosata TaxID=1955412 RepID=UPI00406D0989